MEVEVDANDISEDYIYEATDDIDDAAFENEKCGICMDIVIDRGVLDCCQHWFCFACIDNWATITSLCPLCQNEFQLITCVPVYDTIGSGKDEDDLISRDDDWCIEGENNTLSFPSYYIDENAVICLDGDGCKIRSGLATTEENSSLDTSIACDSCDIWYHAFCVGFDPESTSESSWLCPRCAIDELPKIADGVSIECFSNLCGPETSSRECSVEAAFTRKVSVSVADAGETAVVVSIVEGKQWRDDSSNNILSVLETKEDGKAGTFLSYMSTDSSNLERIIAQPELDPQGTSSPLSISWNTPANQPCDSLPPGKLESNYVGGEVCEPHHSDCCRISSDLLSGEKCIGSEPSEHEPIVSLHPDLVSRSSLSGDNKDRDASARQATGDVVLHSASEESSLPANFSVDKVAPDADKRAVRFSGLKRKASRDRNHAEVNEYSEHECKETRVKMEIQGTAKKTRSDGKSQTNLLKRGVGQSITEGVQKLPPLPAASKDSQLRDIPEKEPAASDIMSIVRATNTRQSNSMQNTSKERDNGAGLRVKKIMRRAVEDKSSALVEDLRKEIREAVRNKATKDFSKSNLFDPKLLAAFRAAIGGSRTEPEPIKRLNPSIVRVKKAMLQKGKTRESLTKKIYGTANGKRRRAWDRDCEIEFWKHRCTKITNPEKVETLKSVLGLLRRNSESSEMEEESEDGAANSILARLYPADTSVFPRSDDVQSLSALTGGGNNEMKYGNSKEKVPKPPNDNHTIQTHMQTSKNSPAVDDANRNRNTPSLEVEAALKKVNTTGALKSGSKVQSQIKEVLGKSDVKTDKRKWALEVLARKTALVERDSTRANQEDNTMLKGNYPLLAQLPMDMRPALAPSRHNKVAIPVRQAQLYRLTEHLLKKANLPVMRRTAETELAIADAVNIEKDVADRSNSKLVYVNLCSQMLRQYVNNTKPCRVEESDPSSSAVCTDRTTDPSPQEPADPSVDEALKMAGLVSDSPPNSPYGIGKNLENEHELSVRARDEGPENVFDMDSRPELDIYGDFEYDLEDEDLFGASALKVSKSQPEEADLKMKVVFSTLNIEKTSNAQDSKEHESLGTIEKAVATPCLLEHNKDVGMRSLTLEVKIDTKFPPSEPLQGEIDGEPSLTECEELYGPDKEPLVEKISNQDSREPDKLTRIENLVCGENANHRSSKAARAPEFGTESCAENIFVRGKFPVENNSSGGENSPTHSLTSENVRRKSKKTNIKPPDTRPSISRKVEAYIKEHIRPLCTSGVITTEQYRWAVGKTTDKVMRFHHKDKNANFLIKEGEKVKKLAEQYVEAAQQKKET